MAKRKKSAPRRRSIKAGKVTRRRRGSSRKSVQMASATGLLALVAGAAVGNAIKDNAAIARFIPNPRTRYMILGGAGLVLGSGIVGKMPAALRPALLGMGAAMVPAILPTIPGLGGGTTTMGRLSSDQMAQLRGFVAKQRRAHELGYHGGRPCDIDIFKSDIGQHGRANVITGRRPVGVITGRKYAARYR